MKLSNTYCLGNQSKLVFVDNRTDEYQNSDQWSDKVCKVNSNIEGFDGWDSFESLFNFINRASNYIVLRNYENLRSMNSDTEDIDFLTSDKDFPYNINGIKKYKSKYRAAYRIKVGGKNYNIDIRFLDDDYYDCKWSKDMVRNRVFNNFLFTPNPKDEFYSLLYHSLIHKNILNDRYSDRLLHLARNIGLDVNGNIFMNRNKAFGLLNTFLKDKDYHIVRPKDFSVQYGHGYKGLKRLCWELIGGFKA